MNKVKSNHFKDADFVIDENRKIGIVVKTHHNYVHVWWDQIGMHVYPMNNYEDGCLGFIKME